MLPEYGDHGLEDFGLVNCIDLTACFLFYFNVLFAYKHNQERKKPDLLRFLQPDGTVANGVCPWSALQGQSAAMNISWR
jgi:hypothetical protein